MDHAFHLAFSAATATRILARSSAFSVAVELPEQPWLRITLGARGSEVARPVRCADQLVAARALHVVDAEIDAAAVLWCPGAGSVDTVVASRLPILRR